MFFYENNIKTIMLSEKCVYAISVGQQYHEGKKLEFSLSKIGTKYNYCTIVVCDTLQRHTFNLINPKLTKENTLNLSYQLGTKWIEQNNGIIDKYLEKNKYEIQRWDDWLKCDEYGECKKMIDTLYINDKICKQSIDTAIKEYLKRKNIIQMDETFTNVNNYCLEYIKEEMAVTFMWSRKYDVLIYPHKLGISFQYLLHNLVKKSKFYYKAIR